MKISIQSNWIIKLLKKVSKLYIEHVSYAEGFTYKGKKINLYEHSYNCGRLKERMTDRSFELALARKWINIYGEDIVEVGAVTPYYFRGAINEIIDPSDPHKAVTINKSLFDVDLNNKTILSISTVEHVGLNDYGYAEKKDSIQAIKYIVEKSKHCLITYPIGYNEKLDLWTKKNFRRLIMQKCKLLVYRRNMLDNKWKLCKSVKEIPNYYGPLWANALVVIEK